MRYTTIIDVMDMPSVRRCRNASWLYYVMAMKCGYHDEDRDVLDMSLSQLAAVSGLSMSAVRHALKVLTKAGLVRRNASVYVVKKWLQESSITPRPKRIERAAEKRLDEERQQREREIANEVERKKREELWSAGKTQFMVYCEGLLERAKNGDEEAAAAFKRHEKAYNEQKQQFKNPKP